MSVYSVYSCPGTRFGAVHLAHRRDILLDSGAHVPGRHPLGRVLGTRRRGRRGHRRLGNGRRAGLRGRLLRDGRRHGPGRRTVSTAAAEEEQRQVGAPPAEGHEPLDNDQGRGHRADRPDRPGVRHVRLAGGHHRVLRHGRGRGRRSRGRQRDRRHHDHHRPGAGVRFLHGRHAQLIGNRVGRLGRRQPRFKMDWLRAGFRQQSSERLPTAIRAFFEKSPTTEEVL